MTGASQVSRGRSISAVKEVEALNKITVSGLSPCTLGNGDSVGFQGGAFSWNLPGALEITGQIPTRQNQTLA